MSRGEGRGDIVAIWINPSADPSFLLSTATFGYLFESVECNRILILRYKKWYKMIHRGVDFPGKSNNFFWNFFEKNSSKFAAPLEDEAK